MAENAHRDWPINGWILSAGVLLVPLLMVSVWLTADRIAINAVARAYDNNIADILAYQSDKILDLVDGQQSDLFDIAYSPSVRDFVASYDSATEEERAREAQALAEWFVILLENSPSIRQLRIIGVANQGTELVRAEMRNAHGRVVPAAELQVKGDRDYFRETLGLPPRTVRISEIDLNKEHGKLDVPQWATLRMSLPLVRKDGTAFGILIANLDASGILFEMKSEIEQDLDYYVMNYRGDFLVHPDPRHEFGFEYGKPSRWDDQFSADREAAALGDTGLVAYMGPKGRVYARLKKLRFGLSDPAALELAVAVSEKAVQAGVAAQRTPALLVDYAVLLLFLGCIYLLLRALGQRNRLAERNTEFGKVIEQSLAAIVTVDDGGSILSCNRAAARLLTHSAQPPLGQNLFALLSLEQPEMFDERVLRALTDEGGLDERELAASLQDGRKVDLLVTAARIQSAHKGKHFYAIIFRDNTEQKTLRDRIQNANSNLERQVRARTEELERARNLAMSANEIKSEFIANISHELRTPLHGIFGMLRLLRQDPLNERQSHRLMLAEQSMAELMDIINSILDVSKLEADKLDIQNTELSLPTLISDVVKRFVPRALQKNLELIIDAAEVTDRLIEGDAARISRILANLVDNAVKFTLEGAVTVTARTVARGDDELVLECSVADTGVGIPGPEKAKLFQTFSRTKTGDGEETVGGAGLGLSVAKQLCNLMNGDISVVSEAGKGSIFSFNLRLTYAETDEADETERVFDCLSGRTVAIVDASAEIAGAVEKLVKSRGAVPVLARSFASLPADLAVDGIALLIIDLDSYLECKTSLQKWLDAQPEDAQVKVFVSSYLTDEAINLEQTFSDNVFLLEKPVSIVSLDGAQLASQGIVKRFGEQPKNLTEEQCQRVWSVIPRLFVLVVDDNLINQKVIGGMLDEYGVNVSYAGDGNDAINVLKKNQAHKFDLIIMDCQMPIMDGYEATRRIRAGTAGSQYIDVPIIAVTAGAMGGDRMKCIESGMTDYLTKPVLPFELEKKILALDFDFSDAADGRGELPARQQVASVEEAVLAVEVRAELKKRMAWNKDDVITRLMGKVEIMNTIIEIYLKSAPDLMSKLEAALKAKDYKQLRSLAHEMKGMSENIGAKKVAYLAYEMEMAAIDRRQEDLGYLMHLLKIDYEKLVDIFKQEIVGVS